MNDTRLGPTDYEDALALIGHKLGLSGAFRLVDDVLKRLDEVLTSTDADIPQLLQERSVRQFHVESALAHLQRAAAGCSDTVTVTNPNVSDEPGACDESTDAATKTRYSIQVDYEDPDNWGYGVPDGRDAGDYATGQEVLTVLEAVVTMLREDPKGAHVRYRLREA